MSHPPTSPYGSVPAVSDSHMGRGYGYNGAGATSMGVSDFGTTQGNPSAATTSPLVQSMGSPQTPLATSVPQQSAFREELDHSALPVQADHSTLSDGDGSTGGIVRSTSRASTAVTTATPTRGGTLKKKASVSRKVSLRRSGSKRSLKAGSIKGIETDDGHDYNSAFHTPIPTSGTPTDILANRFQAWRQLLKSLIAYFREIQSSYDQRAKAVHKVQNTISNITHPSAFVTDGGLAEATRVLADYHKHSIAEANKSRDIENDVVGALTGLRSDLGQKIKEIKGLSGDFKNSVSKEQESTRRAVDTFRDALQHVDHEDSSGSKQDPYLARLGVDRSVEKQIDEENYLHRAYLNLESSGRELESIVVGEIQKAYNALAGILKREGDEAFSVVESLRTGPISMPKDEEWNTFVANDPHFVNPKLPLRQIGQIQYPGKDHPSALEVRAGMLERKSKYLKSYTPGWYVLSSTHLHEFKSADKIYSQPPVMSLYLPDQKLGSKSESGSSSHKFMLKGKQSSGVHRGHNWVFRAESNETMLAWYEAIKILTESTGQERTAFVRKHARSVSGNSARSVSSDGMDEDEADKVPYSADAASLSEQNPVQEKPVRPQPGGRFPSDMTVPRREPQSPSDDSSEPDASIVAASSAMPGSGQQEYEKSGINPYALDGVAAGAGVTGAAALAQRNEYAEAHGKPPHEEIADRNIEADQARGLAGPAPAVSHPQQLPIIPIYQPEQQQPYDRFHGAAAAIPGRSRAPSAPRNYNSSPFQSMDEPLADLPPQPSQTMQPVQPTSPQQMPAEPVRANTQQLLYRHGSSYADWLAPAAGAGVIGAGASGWAANHQSPKPVAVDPQTSSASPEPFGTAYSPAQAIQQPASTVGGGSSSIGDGGSSLGGVSNSTAPTSMSGLGGLESEGARETGRIMPPFIKHDTDMSVSRLHVPGEFPKGGK